MRDYRYSLGLLEVASGGCLLVLALCHTLVQSLEVYPPLGTLPAFIAAPLFFWITLVIQKRLPENSTLATFTLSRRNLLIALAFCVFVLVFLTSPILKTPNTLPNVMAALFSGALVAIGGTGPRVAYLVGGTLLLGLGLAIFAPASYASSLFCIVIALVLIPVGIVTLRRELSR